MTGVTMANFAGAARKYCHALNDRRALCKDTHEQTVRLAPPFITSDELDRTLNELQELLAR